MEEINLDFGKDTHKEVNLSTNNNTSISNVQIIKEPSSLGIDLLVNKSKSNATENTQEFKPSAPVVNMTPNKSINITMDNYSKPDNSFNLNDIGISMDSSNKSSGISNLDSLLSTPTPTNHDSSKNNSNSLSGTNTNTTSIDINNQNDLNLNLDNILNENPVNTTSSNINLGIPIIDKPKSYEELQKEKAEYIRLLERLEQKGIHAHKKYSIESDYNEVKTEFERLSRQRECDQGVKFQRKMLVAMITAVEFLNNKFDPLDLKLDGWSESLHENIIDYDDVFEELHEKYKGKGGTYIVVV